MKEYYRIYSCDDLDEDMTIEEMFEDVDNKLSTHDPNKIDEDFDTKFYEVLSECTMPIDILKYLSDAGYDRKIDYIYNEMIQFQKDRFYESGGLEGDDWE